MTSSQWKYIWSDRVQARRSTIRVNADGANDGASFWSAEP